MIYINFVELYSLILRAKFQNHMLSGSGEEVFFKDKRFMLFMARVAILAI